MQFNIYEFNVLLSSASEFKNYELEFRLLAWSTITSFILLSSEVFNCVLNKWKHDFCQHFYFYKTIIQATHRLLKFDSNTVSKTKWKLKLNFSKNWNAWLSIIRAKITDDLIWTLINSFITIRSIDKSELIEFDLKNQKKMQTSIKNTLDSE